MRHLFDIADGPVQLEVTRHGELLLRINNQLVESAPPNSILSIEAFLANGKGRLTVEAVQSPYPVARTDSNKHDTTDPINP